MSRFLPLHAVAFSLLAASASAEPSANQDLWTGVQLRPLTLSLSPAFGSDIAPEPPIDIVAAAFAEPTYYVGPARLAAVPPPLRLKLELPAVFGITPFATTTFAANPAARLPSTDVGAGYAVGPLQTGTRFRFWRDDSALWLNNATFARYVAPAFDVGLESVTDTALSATAHGPAVRRALHLSAGVHPTPESPTAEANTVQFNTVRVNTSLLPSVGRAHSSISAFGRF